MPQTAPVLIPPPPASGPAVGSEAPYPPAGWRAPAVVIGFATAIAMWCVWFVLHLPAISVPIEVSGPVLLGVQLLAVTWGSARVPAGRSLPVGVAASVLAGVINLALLGSKLSAPAEDGAAQVVPSALAIVGGFLALCLVIGAVGGAIGGSLARARGVDPRPTSLWLARMGVVAAISVVPLLAIGGFVTSSASGLAVPDWPGTYGSNMFLYPIGLMARPRVYIEHTHRLFGTLVGMATITLFVFTLVVERRRWVHVLAGGLLIVVIVQGVLGGTRVTGQSQILAAMHGVVSQLYFAGMVALAGVLSPAFRHARVRTADSVEAGGSTSPWTLAPLPKPARVMGLLSIGALVIQLAMGALYRHLQTPHALYTHMAFSIVVVLLVGGVAGFLSARRGQAGDGSTLGMRANRRFSVLGQTTFATLGVQFLMGWVVFWLVTKLPPEAKAVPTAEAIAGAVNVAAEYPITATLRTLHQANGALVMGAATLCALWSVRLRAR